MESDVSLTRDGVPVLLHRFPALRRGNRISERRASELPAEIPTLEALYSQCGTNFQLALDMSDPRAAEAVVRTAEQFGADGSLWLTYWHVSTLAGWRQRWPAPHLVLSTLPLVRGGLERSAAALSRSGVDALNLHHLVCRALARRIAADHNLLLFAWGVRRQAQIDRLIALPVDGIFCDDVTAMVTALGNMDDQGRAHLSL